MNLLHRKVVSTETREEVAQDAEHRIWAQTMQPVDRPVFIPGFDELSDDQKQRLSDLAAKNGVSIRGGR